MGGLMGLFELATGAVFCWMMSVLIKESFGRKS